MATEVDICNLALAIIGDKAVVASINPPEASAQASYCARFYPMARDTLLEMHTWGFATKRVQLALLSDGGTQWTYSYAQPNDAVNLLEVLDPTAADDYSQSLTMDISQFGSNGALQTYGSYVPQQFANELDANNNSVILTDIQNAELRYTALVSDTSTFSPTFINTLAWHLASMLAGPILKGEAGATESKRCLEVMNMYLSQAKSSDANQRNTKPEQKVPWLSRR